MESNNVGQTSRMHGLLRVSETLLKLTDLVGLNRVLVIRAEHLTVVNILYGYSGRTLNFGLFPAGSTSQLIY